MPRSLKVDVNPKIFQWLRESSGWSIEDVVKRLNTSIKVVRAIEKGERQPTLRQLKVLSKAYKRPLAAFFLPKPVKEPPMPKDYRMLPDKKDIFDKKTIYIIRKARSLQKIGAELSGNIKYSTKPTIKRTSTKIKPEDLAAKYREQFGLTEDIQRKFKTPYEFFNYLRDIFEDMNILVFQFSMPVEDARGFVLTDNTPNVIVVNSNDSIEARLFSLMHEFGHVLLSDTVIDLPDITTRFRDNVEKWCNEFASGFLLPRDLAKEIFKSEERALTDTKTLNSFSYHYKVSKAMLLYNMLKQNFITSAEFKETLDRYKPREPDEVADKETKKKGWGLPQDKRCLSKVGNKFVSIVASNYDKNYITYTDALNYLSVKSRNFDKVLAKARK
ncbi:MAG: XRE family transcriptional regulator [Euryarchaeota archaeon]|nr:XRE family transcriptional regulator [Euryarchaeota archaeon]